MLLSISEIVTKAGKLATDEEKIAFLSSYANNIPVTTIFKYAYDPRVEFLIPDTPPPWKRNSYVGVEGMLYKETRRLKIFIKGGGYDNLNQVKRENLFISLLEDVDNNDADLLVKMITKKPFPGLSEEVVKASFPQLFV